MGGAVAVELILTEGGLLMKVKTDVKAGQNNNISIQVSAQAVGVGENVVIQQSIQMAAIQGWGGGGGVIQQNLPFSAINNNNN
jgi:hypothetical protein